MAIYTPVKRSGWSQGIHEVSTTKKEAYGAMRITSDGVFRYGKAGAACAVGKLALMVAIVAGHEDKAFGAAYAVGSDYILSGTLGTALTASQMVNGYLVIQDDAGEGHMHEILSHDTGTDPYIKIWPGIQVAVTTSTTFTLVHNPWSNCQQQNAALLKPLGVPKVAIASGSYGWFQTRGICPVLINGTVAAGMPVMANNASSIAGAVGPYTAAVAASLASPVKSVVGRALYAANDTEYCPIDLMID